MNPRFVWPSVTLAGLAMVVGAVMAVEHVDVSVITTVIALSATAVLGALVTAQVGEVKTQQAVQATQTQALVEHTNGNYSSLLDIVKSQSEWLARAYPGVGATPVGVLPVAPAGVPVPTSPGTDTPAGT